MNSYCVRCGSKTQDKNPHMKQTSNGRQMVQSSCSRSGTTKCQFVSNTSAKKKGKKVEVKGILDLFLEF